jgi:uncharacterized protein YqcC (DUF446 family)
MSASFVRGAHRDENAKHWHDDGTNDGIFYFPKDANITVNEALQICNLDELEIELSSLRNEWGTTIPNKYALYAAAPWLEQKAFLNRLVGNRYTALQPTDIANAFEGLAETWPVEGVMALKDCKVFVVQLKVSDFEVGGFEQEHHEAWLTIGEDHEKGNLLTFETQTRTVCQNTWMAALRTGKRKMRIPHSGNTQGTLNFVAAMYQVMSDREAQTRQQLNLMITKKMVAEQFNGIVEAAFPLPQGTTRMELSQMEQASEVSGSIADDFFEQVEQDVTVYNNKVERTKNLWEMASVELEQFNDKHPYAADTVFAGFNTVTGMVNHGEMFTGKDPGKRQLSMMLGEKARYQSRAWDKSVELL